MIPRITTDLYLIENENDIDEVMKNIDDANEYINIESLTTAKEYPFVIHIYDTDDRNIVANVKSAIDVINADDDLSDYNEKVLFLRGVLLGIDYTLR